MEAAVASYPDPILGERIGAFIVLHEGQTFSIDQLREFLGTLGVAKYKWPERLKIISALPRNVMNKIDRQELQRKISV